MKKRLLSLLLALMMVMSLLPVGALAAGNSYVVLHPATGTMPTGFKVQVGTKIDWGTVSEVNEKNYDVTIDLGKYNVSNTSFRLPMPEEIWEGVKMQYNPQTYVIAGAGGGVHKTPGASSLLANGGNFFYYYNLGKGESQEGLWNFKLEFDANGGSGAPAALTYSTNSKYEKGHSFVIPTTVPERPGYEFLGWARQSNATEPQYQPGGSYYMLISANGYNGGSQTDTLYAVWKDATSEPDTPTITDFTKERLTAAPSGITIPGVTVSYESPVVIPDGGTVTLLYKLTVTGDVGAAFVIADPDAAFVGSNCNVTTGADGGISGSIPLGGEAVLYVIKTFDRDDIVNGKLTNRAEIAAGDDSELGDGVGPAESETPATEPPEGPGDDFNFDLVNIYVACECDNDPQCEHATQTYRVSDGEFTVGKPVWNASAKQWEVYVTVSGSQARSYIDQAVAVWGNPHTGFETITPSMKLYTLIWDGEAWGKDASAAVTFEVECVHEPVLYTVTITPADIVAYTGGEPYGAIVDSSGFEIEGTSGLPEPGFHLDLSDELNQWLVDNGVTERDLSGCLTFTSGDYAWTLQRIGVYSQNPLRYVYRLVPADGTEKVRVQYRDETGEITANDNITISENSVNATYTMDVFGGLIDSLRANIVVERNGETASIDGIKTSVAAGKLTVLATVNSGENTTPVAGSTEAVGNNTVTAVANNDVTFFVNESEVSIGRDSVSLLIDSVSDSEEYINQMAEHAVGVINGQPEVELENPATELIYLDLVDATNGNTKVTLGGDGKLTIYWPIPDDAAGDAFHIVHYIDMNRMENSPADGLDTAERHIEDVTVDGGYLTFEVSSFSPFVLVYESKDADSDKGEITGLTKTLVTDYRVYNTFGVNYPGFRSGVVHVDKYDDVTLLYKITVEGKPGTEYTVTDPNTDVLEGSMSGKIGDSGEAVIYVARTFYWSDIRSSNGYLSNTALVKDEDGITPPDGSDTERTPVEVHDWVWPVVTPPEEGKTDPVEPEPVEPEPEYMPNWLNTEDHYAYIVGYEDGEVKPNNAISRAEVSTIFFRLLTDDARARYWSTTNNYSDVASDAWCNVAISTLSKMGIVYGGEDGTFRPDDAITRAEFVAIATRFFEYSARYKGTFDDVSYGCWYADSVQAAVDMGLVNGYDDGRFHPDAHITRAEAVAIVNRVLHRVPHEDYLLNRGIMNTWPDNQYGAWYYADMQEATNSHDYEWIKVKDEIVEMWTEKLAERDWKALEQG